jgi:hypothetical protein
MLEELDRAISIASDAHDQVPSLLTLRLLLLKAKIFEARQQNEKTALSIYSKCLGCLDEIKDIERDLRKSLKNEIKLSIKACAAKCDVSIGFTESN